MSQTERWMGSVLRHGVEARLDDPQSTERVTVSLAENGQVQWGPIDAPVAHDSAPHRFHFWVHADSDAERLCAIQILGSKLVDAGHGWDVTPMRPGGLPYNGR